MSKKELIDKMEKSDFINNNNYKVVEVIEGKMIRLDISREPIIFMPTVIVSAVRKAIIIL